MRKASVEKLMENENFKSSILACFGETSSSHNDLEVKFELVTRHYGDALKIEVVQMYEHLGMTGDTLVKLGEVFGSLKYDVNQWSAQGCETCDYGSSYAHEFVIALDELKPPKAVLGKK